ncbi:MAG: hypothetical protein HS115_05120 [Spirochaetales bacterium]|nr:hypothetical protein [Spirochaetales bacterium]
MKKIFFAYPAAEPQIKDAITKAVRDFNHHQHNFKGITWEDLHINGRLINAAILKEIQEADIFICDLSRLNVNVLFELGYAIGLRKSILIFLNENVPQGKVNYASFRVLKGVGYSPYKNARDILSTLNTQLKAEHHVFLEELDANQSALQRSDVLLITNGQNDQASVELYEHLSKSDFKIISDDSYEVEYQTFRWYVGSIFEAQAVIVHHSHHGNESTRNQMGALFGGMALGLGRRVVFLAPAPYNAPIDYGDLLIEYDSATLCAIKADDWLSDHVKHILRKGAENRTELNLIRLGLGCEVAEEERSELVKYFVTIDAYSKAFDRRLSLVVGRKGSGKSALFIKLLHDLADDPQSLTVVLKPDSDELVQNAELAGRLKSDATRRDFFSIVWRFVILSKLLLAIEKKLESRVRSGAQFDAMETEIIDFCLKHRELLSLNFFGVMSRFAEEVSGEITARTIQALYKDLLTSAIRLLRNYFERRSFVTIRLLADNLDKSWDVRSDLGAQSEMILKLLEYGEKIIEDLRIVDSKGLKYSCLVLLRKDIFEFLRRSSREPDKLTAAAQEIDWGRTPHLLQLLVEKRIRILLALPEHDDLGEVWRQHFEGFNAEQTPLDIVQSSVVPRPRDVIYFFARLFESAANHGRARIVGLDWDYARESYRTFLEQSILAEVKAEYPRSEQILELVRSLGANADGWLALEHLKSGAKTIGIGQDELYNILDQFLRRDFLEIRENRSRIEDIQQMRSCESRARFWRRAQIGLRFGGVAAHGAPRHDFPPAGQISMEE